MLMTADHAAFVLRFDSEEVATYGPVESGEPGAVRVERLWRVQGRHWYVVAENPNSTRPSCRAATEEEAADWLVRHGIPLPHVLARHRLGPKEALREGYEILAESQEFHPDWDEGVASQILLRTRSGRWLLAHTCLEPEDLECLDPSDPLPGLHLLEELTNDQAETWCGEQNIPLPVDLPAVADYELGVLRVLHGRHMPAKTVARLVGVSYDRARHILSPLRRRGLVGNGSDGYFLTELGLRVLKAHSPVWPPE